MSGEENVYGDSSKKKTKKRKHNALNEHTPHEVHIKTEPDTDHSTDKKKSKKSKLKHKFSMKLEKNASDEESFLNIKVKEEESKLKLLEDCHSIKHESFKSDDGHFKSKLKKSKKKKFNKYSSDQSDVDDKAKVKHKKKDKLCESKDLELSLDEPLAVQTNGNTSLAECRTTEDSCSESSSRRTRKKKHNKETHRDTKIYNNMEIEDHFSAEETVIHTPKKRKDSCNNKKLSEQIVFEDEDIINSQPLAESEDEPHATSHDQSMSEDEAHTAHRQPSPECDAEPLTPSNHSMSENEDETRTSLRQPSAMKAALAAHVAARAAAGAVLEAGVGSGGQAGVGSGGQAGVGSGGQAGVGSAVPAGVEAWLVVAPRGVAPASIRYIELGAAAAAAPQACKLKAECGRYVGALADDIPALAVLTSRDDGAAHPTVQYLRLQGSIRFHKKLPKLTAAHDLLPDDSQATFIPLPPTKTRHPLFGADYRASIKIPDSVTEQLKDARQLKKKSKKANKVERNETTDVELADEVIHVKVEKSKKKGKRKLSAESLAPEVDSSQPKRKKKKQRQENGDVWHSQRDIEDTLFNF